jgi:hypothetical protein
MIYRELNVVEWIVYVWVNGRGFQAFKFETEKNFKIMILTDLFLSHSAINHLTQWKAFRHGCLRAKTWRCLLGEGCTATGSAGEQTRCLSVVRH